MFYKLWAGTKSRTERRFDLSPIPLLCGFQVTKRKDSSKDKSETKREDILVINCHILFNFCFYDYILIH